MATKVLTREQIEIAQKRTHSNRAAARYLHVSYNHYKKYAKLFKDEESGKTLFELHLNQAGKGIPKNLLNDAKEKPLMDLIEGRIPIEHFDPKKVKQRLIYEGLVEEKCAECGFKEKRVTDQKAPLILNHIDGNKKNFHLDNIQFLCYNCSFLFAASPIEDKQVEAMEDYVDKKVKDFDWELDEYHLERLKELGLHDDEIPGSEFISRQ